MNPVCKPCRAGVFCVNGEETPCRVSCDAGLVLEGFCGSGSASDNTKCAPAPEGSYAVDGVAVPCLTTCEAGKLLTGSCPEGSSADGMTCASCPEGSWCENGVAEPCTVECINGKIISGSCPEGSGSDTVACDPCPAGSFCSDNQVFACKSECPDGKFLDGECSAGSAEDTTHCTPCPSGVFCKGGEQTACTTTCADGQELQGFCSAGSTEDTVSCAPCLAGSFCTGGVASPCKTTCDDGEEFKGTCEAGSATDTTACDICPAGFYCQDGLKAECKKSCDADFEMVGACTPGSVTDTVKCESGNTPAPFFVDWWTHKTVAEGVNEQLVGVATDRMGAETRFTGAAGSTGFIEGRVKMPLQGGKWNIQFYAFWPDYDKKASKDMAHGTYPEQGYGKRGKDTITVTINGETIVMTEPANAKGKTQIPGHAFFFDDFVGDQLIYRFDFTSTTAEPFARPYIVAGEITILRDGTTGDDGAGLVGGKGKLKGFIKDAIDGKKIRKPKDSNDGFEKKGLTISEDPKLLIFLKSQLIAQVKVKGGRYSVNIADGQYTCVAIYRGLMTFYDPLCHVVNGNTVEKDIVMSPFVVPGQVRAVLTWGNLIKDLDCFMLTPHQDISDPPCEVNWKNRKCSSGSVKLDKDDKDGHGPETITAHNLNTGRYRYRVSEYGGDAENRERLLNSEAMVTVYTSLSSRVFEIGKPGTGFIKGNNWYVFTIDGGMDKIFPCDEDTCGHGFHDPKAMRRLR